MQVSPSVRSSLTMALSSSFLIFGYELVRSPTNTLFKEAYGAESLPYALMVVPFVIALALWGYGKLLSALGAFRTFLTTIGVSFSLLLGCYLMIKQGVSFGTALLFVTKEIYVVLLIEQCWSFINSVLTTQEAKRVNGIILGVCTVGTVAGGVAVNQLAPRIGTLNVLLVAIASFAAVAGTVYLAYASVPEPAAKTKSKTEHGDAAPSIFTTFAQEPTLRFILFLILISQVYSTVIGLYFQGVLQTELPNPDEQTAFSGMFFAVIGGTALFFQTIVSPLLMRRFSVTTIQLGIAATHVVVCSLAFTNPGIYAASACYLVFKSLDYSLFRASKEILYIPLSFEARYRAKEWIDVLGYRVGKGGTSAAIGAYQKLFVAVEPLQLLACGTVFAAAWTLGIFLPGRGSGAETATSGVK